jgi:hypothetical protein
VLLGRLIEQLLDVRLGKGGYCFADGSGRLIHAAFGSTGAWRSIAYTADLCGLFIRHFSIEHRTGLRTKLSLHFHACARGHFKYKVLGAVGGTSGSTFWGTEGNYNATVSRMKKDAYRLGANAIILKSEHTTVSAGGGAVNDMLAEAILCEDSGAPGRQSI